MAKVEEVAEERKSKLCATNIILHGITEEKDEKKWVEELQKDLEIEIDSQYIGQIGFKKEFKLRPVKIYLKKIEDKQTIFHNLKKLNNYKEKYEGISITDDYTSAERNVIDESWAEKAKEKNQQENLDCEFIWKVRGNPKKGTLHLKKCAKNKNSSSTQ